MYPVLVKEVAQHGMVRESTFDQLGVPKDTDDDDNTVEKNHDIKSEHRQRFKILTHPLQRKERNDITVAAQAKLDLTFNNSMTMYNNMISVASEVDVSAINRKVLAAIKKKEISTDAEKKRFTLELLHSINNPVLIKFIHSRTYKSLKKPTGSLAWPKKMSVDEAMAGETTLSTLAYDCLKKPVCVEKPIRKTMETGLKFPKEVVVTSVADMFVNPNNAKASELLKNKKWVLLVKSTYRLDSEHAVVVTDEVRDKADFLQKQLTKRLIKHVNHKVDEDKRQHWSMQFTAERLGLASAIQVLLNHTKEDLSCLKDHECLFNPNLNVFRTAKGLKEDGAYAYKDKNNNRVVRCGMNMRRRFDERDAEHWKAAKLNTAEGMKSEFYKSYPRKEAAHKVGSIRKGYRESLTQIVLLGHPLRNKVKNLLTIYQVTDKDNKNIEKMNFSVKGKDAPSLEDKQRKTIYYFIELVYGLMMAAENNVSSNPGFESALRQYGRE